MHLPTALILTLLTTLSSAHFVLLYPPSRNGQNDDVEVTSPCSGYPLSSNRTAISNSSFPLALEMGHDETVIQVLLSLSENPTSEDDFNITLVPTFGQEGLGDFCLPQVMLPSGLDIREGMNGTIQVITDGEGGGGLYACADITFQPQLPANAELPSTCKNNTGVTASALPTPINANMSNGEGQAQSGGSASASAATTGASSSSSAAAGAVQTAVGWGVVGGVVLAGVGML